MNNSVIKDELTDWLIDCNDGVRVEEVRELKKNQLEKNKKNKNFHGYKFDDYENKFRIMSQRIAKIFEDEDSNLLPQILSDT